MATNYRPPSNEPRGVTTPGSSFDNNADSPEQKDGFSIQAPTINLPTGGGAIRGIEEKFQVNSITGTCTLGIPLPISPTRNGATPAISLVYNSGNGNSPFGLGWELSLPSIKRRTDKGIPRYHDADESDVFLLASAEDLVPSLKKQGNAWVPVTKQRTLNGINYTITQYRPRIESGFTRIEKWKENNSVNVFWKTISPGNVHAYFGLDQDSRIQDPDDPSRIFEWLLSRSHDDKGNISIYKYKKEDFSGLPNESFEKNRKSTNTYLKKVLYGNKTPWYLGDALPAENNFLFQLVFDYGEHSGNAAIPGNIMDEAQPWPCRKDPFSTYRPGFEVRTYRRCRRVMMFHCFGNELPRDPLLTRSLDLFYKEDLELTAPALTSPGFSYLTGARVNGHIWQPIQQIYTTKPLPDFTINYQQHEWNTDVQRLNESSSAGMPSGLQDKQYLWVDLYNEGLAGVLTEQGNGWFYKSNLGNGEFSAPQPVNPMPSFTGLNNGSVFLQELEGNNEKYLVQLQKEPRGFFKLQEDEGWQPMKNFLSAPTLDTLDPNMRTMDVTGDGLPDFVITEETSVRWYGGLGEKGFAMSETVSKEIDEEKGPAIVFADELSTIFLADMNGDGLTDIVRIRNGEVCYWPNLGYGRFGAKVQMSNSPVFDNVESFNPRYIRLADVDGSGTIDLIYLGQNDFRVWMNQSGNQWSTQPFIVPAPPVHNLADVAVLDFLGNGTACIVYSTPLSNGPVWYIDLMKGKKPHLLSGYDNNCGLEVTVEYKPSTYFYLEDKKRGRKWSTRLPFPVHCIRSMKCEDKVRKTIFTNSFWYSHGYFDADEREFRGFGRVEQVDTEDFSHFKLNDAKNVVEEILHQPPVRTVSWFHTGSFIRNKKILHQFEEEYFQNAAATEYEMPDAVLPAALSVEETKQAYRACKGMLLRKEVYADDGLSIYPFNAAQSNVQVVLVQPKENNRYASFLVVPSESIRYDYERIPADPRITHSFTIETNAFGLPVKNASVIYQRLARPGGADAIPNKLWTMQSKSHVRYAEFSYTNVIDDDDNFRLPGIAESKSYEVQGLNLVAGNYITLETITAKTSQAAEILFEVDFSGTLEKRLLSHVRNYYLKDDVSGPLALGQMEKLAIPHKTYRLAFTQSFINKFYGAKVTAIMLADAKYVHTEGDAHWWTQTAETLFPANPRSVFYLAAGTKDVYGNETKVEYDAFFLSATTVTDAIGNKTSATIDYRILSPVLTTDANGNRSAIEADELGMVIRSAVMGKQGAGEGDTLNDPTMKMEYDVLNWQQNKKPNFVKLSARETHGDPLTRWVESFSYSDGSGAVIMTKTQAEPGKARKWDAATKTVIEQDADPRWIGNGRTIYNNKGSVVKQFEPYFSTTHEFEDEDVLVESGETAIFYYDAKGRPVRTEFPNGTFARTQFNNWLFKKYDANDTVKNSKWYADRGNPDPLADPEPADAEKRAAWLAASHFNTPETGHLDAAGQVVYIVKDHGAGKTTTLYHELDSSGRNTKVFDQKDRLVAEEHVSLLGDTVYGRTAEKGEKWLFADVMGRMIKTWDNATTELRTAYDKLHRPTSTYVSENGNEILFNHVVYGDELPNAAQNNLKGKAFKLFDQAGEITFTSIDFKGNITAAERRITKEYKQATNWKPLEGLTALADIANAANPLLEAEIFASSTQVDALNRPTKATLPDNTVITPVYSKSSFIKSLNVQLHGQGNNIAFLQNQDYDAKGQRQFAQYGNGLVTNYFYDPKTYRLSRLLTKKSADADAQSLQDLNYTFDPKGNIVQLTDNAQQTHYFNNAVVKPEFKFVYDAIYQLTSATGRELAGIAGSDVQRNNTGLGFINNIPHLNNANAVRNYTEQYEYDDVGNIKLLRHNAANANWAQRYKYEYEDDAANATNRLQSSSLPGDAPAGPFSAVYTHDPKGNITSMPHLSAAGSLSWNFADQLTKVNLGGGGTSYYVYGMSGGRTRKVIERSGGKRIERIYLGIIEIYREYQSNNKRLERNTLHISDNTGRIAQVDTKLLDLDNADAINALNTDVIRYQYSNHLNSATLETDEAGNVISYEEYHPFGTTAYRSSRNGTDVSLKRYRFSGKEMDDETGFYYFGARYYVPWLSRWLNCDPAGFVKGLNLYRYCSNNPVLFLDPNGMKDGPNVSWQEPPALAYDSSEAGKQATIKFINSHWITGVYNGQKFKAQVKITDAEWYDLGDGKGYWQGKDPELIKVEVMLDEVDVTAEKDETGFEPINPGGKKSDASGEGEGDGNGEKKDGKDGQGGQGDKEGKGPGDGDKGEGPGGGAKEKDTSGKIAGSGAGTTWDSVQRGKYVQDAKDASKNAQKVIQEAKEAGDAEKAIQTAKDASKYRNDIRTATQEKLTPGGKSMSKAIEGERSFESMWKTYSKRLPGIEGGAAAETGDAIEISRRIAVAAGESRPAIKALAKVGRVAGPVGIAVGVGLGIYEVYNAPEGEKGRTAAREIGAFAGGLAGASMGMAAGVALAGGISGFLIGLGVIAGPIGWLAIGIGLVGAVAGAWAFGKLGGAIGEGLFNLFD